MNISRLRCVWKPSSAWLLGKPSEFGQIVNARLNSASPQLINDSKTRAGHDTYIDSDIDSSSFNVSYLICIPFPNYYGFSMSYADTGVDIGIVPNPIQNSLRSKWACRVWQQALKGLRYPPSSAFQQSTVHHKPLIVSLALESGRQEATATSSAAAIVTHLLLHPPS